MPEEPHETPPAVPSPPPMRQPVPALPVDPVDAPPPPPDAETPGQAYAHDQPPPTPYTSPAPYAEPPPYAQPYGHAPQAYSPPPPQPYPYPPPQSWSAPPAYTQPGAGRPGIISALGVMAIIVAALSIIGSFFSGCTAAYSIVMAEQSNVIAGAQATIATTAPGGTFTGVGTIDELVAGTAPMNPAERDAIVRALHTRRRLTPPRRRQLEAFLDQYGQQVLSDPAGAPLTTARVLNHIGDVGGEFAGPNTPPTDFFDIKEGSINKNPGRLLVYDDRVLFRPADGADPLRSSADKPETPGGAGGATAAQQGATTNQPAGPKSFTPAGIPGQGLSTREALAVANTVNARASNMMSPQQFQTLKNQLESSTYEAFVQPSTTIPGLTSQVRSAVVRDDGSVHVTFAMGTMTLDPAGKLTDATTTFTGRTPAAANNPNNPWGAMPNWGTLTVNRTAATLVAAEAFLSVLLAILLLVSGILVLRQTPAARKLLLAYGLLKLLTGALAIVALTWFIGGVSATSDGSGFGAAMMARSLRATGTASIVIAGFGLLFPLAVLILMVGSKDVKEYFKNQ